jgi:hypothetical protein
VVVFARPLRPLTRPPEDMLVSYLLSSVRLMVMGKRLEIRSRRPSFISSFFGSASADDIMAGVAVTQLRAADSVGSEDDRAERRRATRQEEAGVGVGQGLAMYWVLAFDVCHDAVMSVPEARVCSSS